MENLELTSVQNDPHILLDHLDCEFFVANGFSQRWFRSLSRLVGSHQIVRHDDTSRNWYFIMDFDLEYTDSAGITKVLPRTAATKDELVS